MIFGFITFDLVRLEALNIQLKNLAIQWVMENMFRTIPSVDLVFFLSDVLPHLDPDLLDDLHQQGVHVMVQSSAHLHILAVVGSGK